MKRLILGLTVGMGLVAASNVSALTTYNLTNFNDTATINGSIWNQINPQSTGTGVLDPFVRIQANTTESGYNTSVGTPLDTKAGTWTHDITLNVLGTVTVNSVSYYQFVLDINQTSADPILSLNEFKLYTRTGALTQANNLNDLTSNATLAYDLDSAGDVTVNMDYRLNDGSGSGDIMVLVPASLLGNDLTKNLYLYSSFGRGFTSNDGFEEWAAVLGTAPPPPSVPEGGATALLLGLALSSVAMLRRKLS